MWVLESKLSTELARKEAGDNTAWFPGDEGLGDNEASICNKLLNEERKLQIIMIIKACSMQGDEAMFPGSKRKLMGEQIM